jgi:uncharacterized membrane protein
MEVTRVRILISALIAVTGGLSHTSYRTLVLAVGLVLGALVVIVALLLIFKRVRPNRYLGLVTLRHDSRTTWYAGNRFLGIALVLAGLVTIIATVIIWVAKPSWLAGSNKKLAAIEAGIVIVPAVIAYVVSAMRYR